jgi:lysophospholipase L1-like esterase
MQQIQIKPGHTNVLIAGHKLASAGDVVTLSDAEYLTLDPALFDVVFTDLGQVGMLAAQVEWGNGSRVAFMGDSITAGGIAAGRFGAYSPRGFPVYALLASGGRLVGAAQAGKGGDYTSNMVTRFAADVISVHPDIVVICGGTNDVINGVSTATTMENLVSMVRSSSAAGSLPVMATIPPVASSYSTSIRNALLTLNREIRDYANDNGVPLVDFHAAVVATDGGGDFAIGNRVDDLHPSPTGARLMGEALWTRLSALPVGCGVQPPVWSGDTSNLLGDGCFTTGDSTIPTG